MKFKKETLKIVLVLFSDAGTIDSCNPPEWQLPNLHTGEGAQTREPLLQLYLNPADKTQV